MQPVGARRSVTTPRWRRPILATPHTRQLQKRKQRAQRASYKGNHQQPPENCHSRSVATSVQESEVCLGQGSKPKKTKKLRKPPACALSLGMGGGLSCADPVSRS